MHQQAKQQFETQTWFAFEQVLKTDFMTDLGFDPGVPAAQLSTRERQTLANIGGAYRQHPSYRQLLAAVTEDGIGRPAAESAPAVLALCREIAADVLARP